MRIDATIGERQGMPWGPTHLQAPSLGLGGLMVAVRFMLPVRTSQIWLTPDTCPVATIQSTVELVPLDVVDPPVVRSPFPEMTWELECMEVKRGMVTRDVTKPALASPLEQSGAGPCSLVTACCQP